MFEIEVLIIERNPTVSESGLPTLAVPEREVAALDDEAGHYAVEGAAPVVPVPARLPSPFLSSAQILEVLPVVS